MIRCITILAAVGAITTGFAHAQSQPVTKGEQPNRVVFEYVRPQNADLQAIYEGLKGSGALEKIQKILSPVRLPTQLMVKTMECGRIDAFYKRGEFVPTVIICYELLQHILDSLPKDATIEGVTADEAKAGQVLFLTLHEAGHAAFEIFDVSIFGREEDAADNFATYIMLQFMEARRLIKGAAWAWSQYLRDYRRDPAVRVRLSGFADNHGQPQQRFYNLACLAVGSDPQQFADFILEGYLPQTRAQSCVQEYRKLDRSFRKQIGPHLDMELAKAILEAKWLPDSAAQPEPPKQ